MKRKVVFPDSIFKSSTGCHDPLNTASNAVLKQELGEATIVKNLRILMNENMKLWKFCSN